jgi:hypothetical protein
MILGVEHLHFSIMFFGSSFILAAERVASKAATEADTSMSI